VTNLLSGLIMRRVLWLRSLFVALSAAAALAAGAAAAAPADDNLAGLETANGRLARDFVDLWFNQHKPEEAFDRYVSHDHYMNHAVYSASVNEPKSFEQEKQEESRATPSGGTHFDFKQIIVQGSLVFLHIQVVHAAPDPGSELVILLRIRDGKITDHWDLHAPLKPDSAVFAGLDR
jgi:predicted SnoaL-like aldol condensation-catalyzing enzyme